MMSKVHLNQKWNVLVTSTTSKEEKNHLVAFIISKKYEFHDFFSFYVKRELPIWFKKKKQRLIVIKNDDIVASNTESMWVMLLDGFLCVHQSTIDFKALQFLYLYQVQAAAGRLQFFWYFWIANIRLCEMTKSVQYISSKLQSTPK